MNFFAGFKYFYSYCLLTKLANTLFGALKSLMIEDLKR